MTYLFEKKKNGGQQFTHFEGMDSVLQSYSYSQVVLFFSRIAVNFAGSSVELNFKSADKDLPQPLLCRRKGAVVDVLV